jgi:hypothetical protein
MDEYELHLQWRGIEKPCDKCSGSGVICYGSTSTWRGGIGGCAMTNGVCDKCWGSGDADHHWTDLRRLRAEEEQRVFARADTLLSDRTGCSSSTMRPAILALIELLRKEGRRRKPPVASDFFRPWQRVCDALASVLGDAVDAAEKRELVYRKQQESSHE